MDGGGSVVSPSPRRQNITNSNNNHDDDPSSASAENIESSVGLLRLESTASSNGNKETTDNGSHDAMKTDPAMMEDAPASSSLLLSENDFVMPKAELPPKSVLKPVQTFVSKAIRDMAVNETPSPQARQSYRVLTEAVRFQKDKEMLLHILLALRTSGNTLNWLVSSPKLSGLVHYLVRLNPFDKQVQECTTVVNGDNPKRTWTFVDTKPEDLKDNDHNESTNKASSSRTKEKQDNVNKGNPNYFALANAHFQLLIALVSSKTIFVIPTLTALWRMIESLPCDTPVKVTNLIHASIANILRLCPKGKTELFSILAAGCPFTKHCPEARLLNYYQHCWTVVRYLPSIQNQVLELIIEKCLELDVEIIINDTGEAAIEKDENDEGNTGMFEYEPDPKADTPQTPTKTTATPNKTSEEDRLDEMANKLDSMMMLLFRHVERKESSLDQLFPTLLDVFTNSILITHKSKFVQFIVFYACGLDYDVRRRAKEQAPRPTPMTTHVEEDDDDEEEPFYRALAAKLIDMLVDPFRATSTRQTAACYLASFVSRTAFCPAGTVCEAVSALLRWAEVYMQTIGSNGSVIYASDSRSQSSLHSLFYTVCQAAFYIMCFRGKEAVDYYRGKEEELSSSTARREEMDIINVDAIRWTNLCSHALRPLNYCLESVKEEFLHLASVLHLLDPTALDQIGSEQKQVLRKRRKPTAIRTPGTLENERRSGGIGGLGRGRNPLDSFFPFDPYLLRQSHVYVEPFYNHWSGSVVQSEDAEDVEDGTAVSLETPDEEPDKEDDTGKEEMESGWNDDDDESDDDSDTDDENHHYGRGSYQSMDTSRAGNSVLTHQSSSPTEDRTREQLQLAWTLTLKRSRAPSIENGSW